MKGEPSRAFKNVFHFFWGIEDIAEVYLDIWRDAPTNKIIGSVFSNDVPGNALGDAKLGMPAAFAQAGYRIVDIGKFALGTDAPRSAAVARSRSSATASHWFRKGGGCLRRSLWKRTSRCPREMAGPGCGRYRGWHSKAWALKSAIDCNRRFRLGRSGGCRAKLYRSR